MTIRVNVNFVLMNQYDNYKTGSDRKRGCLIIEIFLIAFMALIFFIFWVLKE